LYQINRFRIKGVRRLLDVDLEIRPFTTIIGVNGVGKTSLLDAFSLLFASADGNLEKKLSALGGIANILTREKADALEFSVGIEIPNGAILKYKLNVTSQGMGYSITNEELFESRHQNQNPYILIETVGEGSVFYNPPNPPEQERVFLDKEARIKSETALSQAPKTFIQTEKLRYILAKSIKYRTLDTGSKAPVRLPQQMSPVNEPGQNGEDLIPYLYNLRETSEAKFEAITDTVKAAFPDFKEFGFPPVASGMLTMTWKDKNFARPLYINELSDGTLRFLWLVSLLQSPTLPAITMIDEPDISLHPKQMRLLVDLMREASSRTRLIIATHSDRFVSFLEPKELLVFDINEEGETSATHADAFDLERWLDEYRLDELWSMGHLTA